MLAKVTSKGQVTVPKSIREQLKIEQGTQLDFTLHDDGSILVRPLKRSALTIVGLIKRSPKRTRTVEEMNQAVGDAAVERHLRSSPGKSPTSRS